MVGLPQNDFLFLEQSYRLPRVILKRKCDLAVVMAMTHFEESDSRRRDAFSYEVRIL